MVVQLLGILKHFQTLIRVVDDDDDDDGPAIQHLETNVRLFLNLPTSQYSPIVCYIDINVINTKLGSLASIQTPKRSIVLVEFI